MAIVETYLVYLFFVYVGLMGLLTAYAHVVFSGANFSFDRMGDEPL